MRKVSAGFCVSEQIEKKDIMTVEMEDTWTSLIGLFNVHTLGRV